jgi:hypothetical protein
MSLEHNPAKGVRRFRRSEACKYLKEVWGIDRSPRTLAKEACQGGGPEMVYAGRFPTYAEPALDTYAQSKLSRPVRSTSELREVA